MLMMHKTSTCIISFSIDEHLSIVIICLNRATVHGMHGYSAFTAMLNPNCVLFLQMVSIVPVQSVLRDPRHRSDDLHDGDGEDAWRTWRIHTRNAELAARTLNTQPDLFLALYPGPGAISFLTSRSTGHARCHLNVLLGFNPVYRMRFIKDGFALR